MLEEYAAFPLFRTVGIDSTFYAPPTEETLRGWARHLPPGFPCVSKVWDRITIHTFSPLKSSTNVGWPPPWGSYQTGWPYQFNPWTMSEAQFRNNPPPPLIP